MEGGFLEGAEGPVDLLVGLGHVAEAEGVDAPGQGHALEAEFLDHFHEGEGLPLVVRSGRVQEVQHAPPEAGLPGLHVRVAAGAALSLAPGLDPIRPAELIFLEHPGQFRGQLDLLQACPFGPQVGSHRLQGGLGEQLLVPEHGQDPGPEQVEIQQGRALGQERVPQSGQVAELQVGGHAQPLGQAQTEVFLEEGVGDHQVGGFPGAVAGGAFGLDSFGEEVQQGLGGVGVGQLKHGLPTVGGACIRDGEGLVWTGKLVTGPFLNLACIGFFLLKGFMLWGAGEGGNWLGRSYCPNRARVQGASRSGSQHGEPGATIGGEVKTVLHGVPGARHPGAGSPAPYSRCAP